MGKRTFKPSDIDLRVPFPLSGVFGKHEYEVTIALLVKALELNGDEWRAISAAEIVHTVRSLDSRVKEWRRMFENPFSNIDPIETEEAGWITVERDPVTYALTGAALDRLRDKARRP